MARYVFAADRRPNWELADQLVGELDDVRLRQAGEAYGIDDLGAVRASMFSGLVRLRREWDRHFFVEGGVISADTTELAGLAVALTELGIARLIGLTVNATRARAPAASDLRTRADAFPRRR
jgi:hypothetical protein